MFDGFAAASDAGVNLGSSRVVSYTQIRESSTAGVPNRASPVIANRLDPLADNTRKTVNWRDAP
jgi:hypothetical protein